ncbi:MAG: cytochrome c [Roseibacillus sp.]|jgi:mono/diheme cytochrome c family protein
MADSNQPADPKRPDLEESTNVAEAHASLIETGAAQAREKRIQESGMEPVSLWVILASAVVLLVGGGVLAAGGKLFDYDPQPEGYIRADFDEGGEKVAVIGPLLDAMMKRGKKIYTAKCNGCHQSTGEGDGSQFPPLAGSEWPQGNTERLAMIILNGLKGPITVKGRVWKQDMSPPGIVDKTELAAVMTYVRNSFGNSIGDVVTPAQAASALEIMKTRTPGQVTAAELNANHDKMLEGEAMDPTTIVDFETLEPVSADPAEK